MRNVLACLATVAVMVLAGCDGSSVPTSAGDPPTDRVSGDWQLVEGEVDGVRLTPLPGLPVTLSADHANGEDVLAGLAACNGYGLEVRYTGTSIRTGTMSSSAAGCHGPQAELESTYSRALGRIGRAEQEGDHSLVLTGPGVTLAYEPLPPVPLTEAVGVRWLLESADPAVPTHPPWPDGTPWIEFSDDGTVAGSSGCRRLDGTWIVWRGDVVINGSGYSGSCRPAYYTADNAVLPSLFVRFEVAGDRLRIRTRTPATLTYVRRP